MSYQRGDIVEVQLPMPPDNRMMNHPAVIISNQAVYDNDECYICVMFTSSQTIDEFSFEITQSMLLNQNTKPFTQARCHLISFILDSHIIGNRVLNRMKQNAVDRLVEAITVSALTNG